MTSISNINKKRFAGTLSVLATMSSPAYSSEVNLLEQAMSGGLIVLVILGLSIISVGVAIERFLRFTRSALVPPGLAKKTQTLWAQKEFDTIHELLKNSDSTMSRALSFMMSHRDHSRDIASTGAGDIASMELRHHQQKAYPLAVVATIAPIVGLLGTVIGMIEAFHVVAYSGEIGDPALLADGISKALTTTAAGLIVALPSLGLHHFFKSRTVFYGLLIEKQLNEMMSQCFSKPHQQ